MNLYIPIDGENVAVSVGYPNKQNDVLIALNSHRLCIKSEIILGNLLLQCSYHTSLCVQFKNKNVAGSNSKLIYTYFFSSAVSICTEKQASQSL